MAEFLQHNDIELEVDDTDDLEVKNAVSAVFEIFNSKKTVSLLTKTLGDGITPTATGLSIKIEDTDVLPVGAVFAELKVQGPTGNVATAFQGILKIKPTFITSL